VDAGVRILFEENRTTALATGVVNTVQMSEAVVMRPVQGVAPVMLENPEPADTFASREDFFGSTRALQILGSRAVNVVGSNLDDLIIGNRAANTIEGGNGNDIILGGSGADILLGQGGNDVVIGGSTERIWGISTAAGITMNPTVGQNGSPLTVTVGGQTVAVKDTFLYDADALQTGDKLLYTFSGGAGGRALLTPGATAFTTLTTNSEFFVQAFEGGFRLASSAANLAAGQFMRFDVASWNNGTNHNLMLNNTAYTATNLPGNDYVSGGTGEDTLVSYGSMGSATTANVRDLVTLVGGSGADRFELYANSGAINMIGGSGSDQYAIHDAYNFIPKTNKTARIFDFTDGQDLLMTGDPISVGLLGQISADGLVVSSLGGSLQELNAGNYRQLSPSEHVDDPGLPAPSQSNNPADTTMADVHYSIGGYSVSLADLVQQAQLHG